MPTQITAQKHLPPLISEYVYSGITPSRTLIILAAKPKLDHKPNILFASCLYPNRDNLNSSSVRMCTFFELGDISLSIDIPLSVVQGHLLVPTSESDVIVIKYIAAKMDNESSTEVNKIWVVADRLYISSLAVAFQLRLSFSCRSVHACKAHLSSIHMRIPRLGKILGL